MSYILDALKKIEHEKNKKARSDGRVSITGDLYHERRPPPSRGGLWKVLALIAFASLVTCAGTWLVLQNNSVKRAAAVRPPVPSPPVPVSTPVVTPAVPVPVQPPVIPAAVLPVAPIAAVPVVPKHEAAAAGDNPPPEGERRSLKKNVPRPSSRKPAAAVQTVPTVQAPSDIKLSGIAWQDERAARRAVVNGFLLKEGAVVSGGRITEILADRVRFSSAAGQFEIKLDAVLPAGVER